MTTPFWSAGNFSAIGVLEDDLSRRKAHILGEKKPCGLILFLGTFDELDLEIGGGLCSAR